MNFQQRARPQSNEGMLEMLSFLNDPNKYQAKLKVLTDKEAEVQALVDKYHAYKSADDLRKKAEALMAEANRRQTEVDGIVAKAKEEALLIVSSANQMKASVEAELETGKRELTREKNAVKHQVAITQAFHDAASKVEAESKRRMKEATELKQHADEIRSGYEARLEKIRSFIA
jgi:hypothetical protein